MSSSVGRFEVSRTPIGTTSALRSGTGAGCSVSPMVAVTGALAAERCP